MIRSQSNEDRGKNIPGGEKESASVLIQKELGVFEE